MASWTHLRGDHQQELFQPIKVFTFPSMKLSQGMTQKTHLKSDHQQEFL